MSDMVPEQLRYTPTHEWCRMDGQTVVIGVTDHGVAPVGNVIYVELPEAGDDVLHEVPFGEVEGTRNVKDLVSPFDGVVEAVNSAVVLRPEVLMKEPYESWLIRLKPDSPASFENLLSASDYEDQLRKRRGK
ncbi:MAG: glycine cleavage system protein H [Candidatus Brocadiia bacterium]